MSYDVIVLGVGGMGSAAVYHLARRGARVLGIEQFDIPHDLGSSHGVTRIIRLAYAEGASYVPLLRRAYELWRELEHLTQERLLIVTGGIDAGRESSRTIAGSRAACQVHDLPHEILDASSLQRRFPGCRFPSELVAIYQPDAGMVLCERAIVAHVEAALALGAEVHGRERVTEWQVEKGEVIVRTDRSEYRARRLVVTAGAWVGRMLPFLAASAVPERQVLLWSQPLTAEHFRLGAFPVFNLEADEGRYYGSPVYGIPGFKIGRYHHLEQAVDPDRMDRACHPADEQLLRDAIVRYFPDANGPTLSMKTCLFTNSPDGHFILDCHPDHAEIAIAAGFSGHGYKFCSVVGEIMADLALDGGTRWDLDLFRLSRLV